jgi:hypothetical protein
LVAFQVDQFDVVAALGLPGERGAEAVVAEQQELEAVAGAFVTGRQQVA